MSNACILFVDDSENDVYLAQSQLRRAGVPLEAVRAASQETFRELLAAGSVALVVSEMWLCEFTAFEALEITRGAAPSVPVIFWVRDLDASRAATGLKRGAYACIDKGTIEELIEVAKMALLSSTKAQASAKAQPARPTAQRVRSGA